MKHAFAPFATVLLIIALLACANYRQGSNDRLLISSQVTKIATRLPGKVSTPDDDLLVVIESEEQIKQLIDFVREQDRLTDWQGEIVDGKHFAPSPLITLYFYRNETPLFSFGMNRKYFSRSYKGYDVRKINDNERRLLLSLLKLSDDEFLNLEKKSRESGPWKNK